MGWPGPRRPPSAGALRRWISALRVWPRLSRAAVARLVVARQSVAIVLTDRRPMADAHRAIEVLSGVDGVALNSPRGSPMGAFRGPVTACHGLSRPVTGLALPSLASCARDRRLGILLD